MSNSETYGQAIIEELYEKEQKKSVVIADFSEDACEEPFQCVTSEDENETTLTFKVYHLPKDPQEWIMFANYMKLFNADPKAIHKQGLELEKLRAEMHKPNALLFTFQKVWKKY
jgi:hypothetical protein